MKPGRKRRFATKTADFSKELYKNLLGEVFSFRDISRHAQAEGVNPSIMPLVQLFEGSHVPLSSTLRQSIICGLCLGFGCGHVCLCSGKQLRSRNLRGFFATTITDPPFQ